MDWDDSDQREAFFAVHSDLPREGPGSRTCTLRALDLVGHCLDLTCVDRVLDLGCGPGLQSEALAEALPRATIVALDRHLPFVLSAGEVAAGVRPLVGDMAQLPLRSGSCQLVWSEGAAYVLGVEQALDAWLPTLRRGGVLAFSECVWLSREPSARARAFWQAYPGMRHQDEWLPEFERRGVELVGRFVLPPEAWWDDYYGPMERRLARLEADRAGDAVALRVFAECREEIHLYRDECSRAGGPGYGYVFYVLRAGRSEPGS